MCMFCAALLAVVTATAVAQGEQRKKIKQAESRQPTEARAGMIALSPRRISQLGALAFVGVLIASVVYHTQQLG